VSPSGATTLATSRPPASISWMRSATLIADSP